MRERLVEEGLRILNADGNLDAWGRRVRVAEVNELARRLGVTARSTKDATVSALGRAARPALVEQGFRALTSGDVSSFATWGRSARVAEVRALAREVGASTAGTKMAMLVSIEAAAARAKILRRQALRLDNLIRNQEARILRIFSEERALFFERLVNLPKVRRIQELLRAVRGFESRLRRRLDRAFASIEKRVHERLASDLAEHVDGFRAAQTDAALAGLRKLGRYRAIVQNVVGTVLSRIQAQGMLVATRAPADIARYLAGSRTSHLANLRHRVALNARMWSMQAYNDGQMYAAQTIEPPEGKRVRKRIDEFLDDRNHPFSRAANGTRAPLDQNFHVPVAAVAAWAATLKRSSGGIFWPIVGGDYVGASLPAHFNDRGRVIIEVV